MRTSLDTMQPPVRQSPAGRKDHTSPESSGKLDPLLQFESEERSKVRRRDDTRVSLSAPSAIAPSRSRAEAVPRPPRKADAGRTSRPRDRRRVWLYVVGATGGSVLVGWILVKMTALQLPVSYPFVPPPQPAMVRTTAPVAVPPDVVEPRPTIVAAPEKPAVRASVKTPSPAVEAPPAPPAVSRPVPAAPRFHGSLAIDSVPANARAFINGEAVGITPLVLSDIPVGSRAIRIEADDHVAWSSTVRVVAGEQTRVSATLSPSR